MIQALVLSLLLVFLTACGTASVKPLPPEAPPNVKALTAPTQIEGAHASMLAVANDPLSTGNDLTLFGLQAEGAVQRCNIDKAALAKYLTPEQVKKCRWYMIGCKESQ